MTQNTNQTIQVYGSDREIDEFAGRIKLMVKGGAALANGEARALAQISKVTGLNPFIGEVWYIPGKGPMIGIAGARRLFNEGNAGHDYAFVELIPVSREEAGVPDEVKDVVACFRCEAHSSAATREYQKLLLETLEAFRAAGSTDPFGDAREVVGKKPLWQGWGYSTKSELSKMNKVSLAKKRAEADALKKRIVVPFGLGLPEVQVSVHEDLIEAEAEEIEDLCPTELEIESSVPGPSRAMVNQHISDFEWGAFTKLVERAQRAGIPIKEYNREKMTPDFLNKSTIFYQDQLAKKVTK